MSSSKDLFGPEDFENLIAAVESLDIPSDDDSTTSSTLNSTTSSTLNSYSDNVVNLSTASKSKEQSYEVDGDPLGKPTESRQIQENDFDEFSELDALSDEYDELDFDDISESPNTFSPTTSFAPPSKPVQKSGASVKQAKTASNQVASFTVDDPFASSATTAHASPAANTTELDSLNNEEDELIDVYASFLDATDDDQQSTKAMNNSGASSGIVGDDFSELASLSGANKAPAEKLDYFGDDGFEVFDGVAAANEISALWDENPNNEQSPVQPVSMPNPLQAQHVDDKPLNSTMAKTKMAADKLKAHLESLSTHKHIPVQAQATTAVTQKPQIKAQEMPFEDAIKSDLDPEFADLAVHASFEDPGFQAPTAPAKEPVKQPAKAPIQAMSEAVSAKIKETVSLTRKTEVISDNMLAAFVDSPLNSKQKVRFFSLQNFALRLPRVYLGCTTLLALVGFAYILAIPALLAVTMINGFEMLDSPFTNNMVMLLLALFSISLFLFLVGYKLIDLKFVGPGGITLNHENASALIDKIQQLQQQRAVPKIHEVILTRRHELNLIKIPRFGIPLWSKNVLAIGYPLLQTLPVEYFDVALSRRLTQFKKRRNVLHNWLSFMRRTWTIYAVSLKDRKGVIDLLHYCFFAPYASLYRSFAVYVTQKDELLADEKALHHCNDRDLLKTAQTLRITRAMLLQYFWPKLNEDLQSNTAAPHYVQPYSKLPETLNTLLRSKNVDSWFIRLGQEEINPGDPEAPFALRMKALAQRKVAIPDAFDTSAAQHYFDDQYDKMTDLMNTLWAEEVQKELFQKNIHDGKSCGETLLPCHLAIEPA